MKKRLLLYTSPVLFLSACATQKQNKDNLVKALDKHPEIIINSILKHPHKYMTALHKADLLVKNRRVKELEIKEKKQQEQAFNSPFKPHIRDDETIVGNKDAPITIVEYADFQCHFCSRGHATVTELMNEYKGKIRFVYKHLPLSFHPQAFLASTYYEAIRKQSSQKAIRFHHKVFSEQEELKNGKKYLTKLSKNLGVNMKRLHKDLEDKKIIERINQDIAEAKRFGISGTPAFLINGVPLKGALPKSHFVSIINKLKEKGRITL